VRLSCEATVEKLKEIEPYAVFVATGTDEVVPGRIPGIFGDNVYRVRDVLEKKVSFRGKKIAIIGGGMTGIETAHFLALKNNDVTVIEMLPEKTLPIADKLSFGDAFTDGVKIHYEHQLMNIEPDGINVKDLKTDTEKKIDVDAVILSMGIRPNMTLPNAVKENFENVIFVGDANKLGKIPNNIRSGADAAAALK
jgi:pyruvate/2-oxoglutarate dehydrogenase complex dihydrolipoamide dehydrogenase (E3) component